MGLVAADSEPSHLQGKKIGAKWKDHRILTLNNSVVTFRVPNLSTKVHQNRIKIAAVGARTDRQ